MARLFGRRGRFIGLSWGLIALHVGAYWLVVVDPVRAFATLGLSPGDALARPWTFFTYQFLNGGMLGLLGSVASIFFIGMTLEHEWGSATFAILWLLGVFGASGAAAIVGIPLAGSIFLGVSLLAIYAILYPETRFLLMFTFPVPVKYLAIAVVGITFFQAASLGLRNGGIFLLGLGLPVLFFQLALRPQKTLVARAFEVAKEAGRTSADARLEERNRKFFERASRFSRPAPEAGVSPELDALRADLRGAIAADVRICKPADYKGDTDPICRRCEGFAECTLRYLGGEPAVIIPSGS